MSSLHTVYHIFILRDQSEDQRVFYYFAKTYVYLTYGHENTDLIEIHKDSTECWHFCIRGDIDTALPLFGMLSLKQEWIKVLISPHLHRCSANKKAAL